MSTQPPVGPRLARFASFNFLHQGWLVVLSLVATPVLYHRLGEAAYGLLAIVNLVAAQLAILEFGFGHATIRRLSVSRAQGDREEMSRTLSTSSWVFVGTAAVGVLIVLASTDLLVERFFQIPPELVSTAKTALRIGAAFFALSVFGNLAGAVWQGLQRFGFQNLVSGVAASAQILGSLVLVILGFGVIEVLIWSVVLAFLTLAVSLWWLARVEPGIRVLGPVDRRAFREMAAFGFLLMVAGLLGQLFLSGGPLVLGHFVLVSALPFFTVPFSLYQRLTRMGYGLAAALYPLVAEMEGLGDRPTLVRVFASGTRMLLLAGTAAMVPAVLLATPFLTLWMGPEFAAQGGRVLELLFIAFVFSLATIPTVELARGAGRAGLLAAYNGVMAAVSIAGVLLLAPSLGVLGAAVAFLGAQVTGSTFLLIRVGGAECRRAFPLRVLLFVGSAALAGAFGLVGVTGGPGRLGLAVALGAILAAWGITWGLDDEERVTLRRMVRRP